MATKKKAAPKKRKPVRKLPPVKSPIPCTQMETNDAHACEPARERPTPQTAAHNCLAVLGELSHDAQNAALAVIFQGLKAARDNRLRHTERNLNDAQSVHQNAQKSQRDLENIGLGLFSVFQS